MSGPRYTFDRWTLDGTRGALTAGAEDIPLRPKSFEVLHYLVQNAGRLVSRDDVLDAVWPGVTVTEESLTQCVSEVRQALGDTDQRIIKTVPKRGYLFAMPNVHRRTLAEIEDGLIPALQDRGLVRKAYEHKQFRDNLLAF